MLSENLFLKKLVMVKLRICNKKGFPLNKDRFFDIFPYMKGKISRELLELLIGEYRENKQIQ